jgi:hypothetical protein
VLVVIAPLLASSAFYWLANPPSTGASPIVPRSEQRSSPPSPAASPIDIPSSENGGLPAGPRGARREADGVVPAGTTVFDDEVPGIARLDPDLVDALREAATDAAVDGIEILVNSGWRSAEYQEHLRQDAVLDYGSDAEAARWVATAETSEHVTGDAIDLGLADATAWLSEHGADYGLCQIYGNEPWHYELRPAAVDQGCPAMYADPTHDPRMQQ